MKLLVDTNIILDALVPTRAHHRSAELLIMLGYVHELDLWASVTQWTDRFYLLSEGGKRSCAQSTKQQLTELRKAVRVVPMGEYDIDCPLASPWLDFEDACVHQAAIAIKADAIVTRNKRDFEMASMPVYDCDELFARLSQDNGINYALIDF